MKRQKEQITVYMTTHGIDKASEAVAAWLEKAGKRRRHLLPLRPDRPDGHSPGGGCHLRYGHHLSALPHNKLAYFHCPSGNSPAGRSAWPAEPGDPTAEISCCLRFQRRRQQLIILFPDRAEQSYMHRSGFIPLCFDPALRIQALYRASNTHRTGRSRRPCPYSG